jgi:hypothetical protein
MAGTKSIVHRGRRLGKADVLADYMGLGLTERKAR